MPKFKENPSPLKYEKKSSGFKMKGSPLKQEEVVSKTSPGPGWTKTKGTNIWAPPKPTFGDEKAKATMTKIKRDAKMTKMPTIQPGHTKVG